MELCCVVSNLVTTFLGVFEAEALSNDAVCMTSVCLSRTSYLSREQRGLGRLQEAQLMLTTGAMRLVVSRGQQTWYHFGSVTTFR